MNYAAQLKVIKKYDRAILIEIRNKTKFITNDEEFEKMKNKSSNTDISWQEYLQEQVAESQKKKASKELL